MRLWIDTALGKRLVASSIDEFRELRVGHLMPINPETVDLDRMTEPFLRPFLVRSHHEAAARDEDHSRLIAVVGWQGKADPRLTALHRPISPVGQRSERS